MRRFAPVCLVVCLPSVALAQKSQVELQNKIQELIKKGVPGASTKVALYQEAQSLYEEYLTQYPNASDAIEARFGYAEVLFRMGELGDTSKWPSAAKQYQQVLSTKSERSADAALGVLVSAERWAALLPTTADPTPEAEAILALYQDLYPRVAGLPKTQSNADIGGQCAFRSGELYLRYQKNKEALAWFEKGLTDYPTSSSEEATATQLLVLLLQQKQTEQLKVYTERFRKDPELSKSKSFIDALDQLDAQQSTRSCLDLFQNKAWLDAAKCFDASALKAPIDRQPEMLFNGAVAYKKAEQLEDSLRLFQSLLTKFPKAKESQYALLQVAYSSLSLLDIDVAISSFDEYVKRYPGDKEVERALQDLVALRLASLQYEEAAAALTKLISALEKRGADAKEIYETYADLAELRERQGAPSKEQKAWEKVLTQKTQAVLMANAHAALGHLAWQKNQKNTTDIAEHCLEAMSAAKTVKDDPALNDDSLSRCAFYMAELKVREAEKLSPPKTLDEEKLNAWLVSSRRLLEESRVALNRVKDFGASTWALGALFRAGQLSMAHAQSMKATAKLLKEKNSLPLEVADQRRDLIFKYVVAYQEDAETAWSTCAQGAALVRDGGVWLEQCEERLYALNPALYPQPLEWVAPPTTEAIPVFAPFIVETK